MPPQELEVLIPAETIQKRVAELGAQISADYRDQPVLLVGVLTGSFIFLADLIRHLTCPLRIQFIGTKSYEGASTTGQVQLTKDLDSVIEGVHVLVVEDIIDTGLTLSYLKKLIQQGQPASLRVATFLDKPSRRKVEIQGDYVGFEIEDKFVVGYGLDYNQLYRNLPDLRVVKQQ
jgi:hypoxanthine phosphoribosyltransferase